MTTLTPTKRNDLTQDAFALERQAAGGQDAPEGIANVANAVIKYEKVELYTTFLVEYAFVDSDIVIHFFPPREAFVRVHEGYKINPDFHVKWQRAFPEVLSPVAEEYFQATKPRVIAQYTPELASWYMRCRGFADMIDPTTFVLRFFAKLDEGLDRAGFSVS